MTSLGYFRAFIRCLVSRAPTTSWWWKLTRPSRPTALVAGLPTSCISAAIRRTKSGPSSPSSRTAFETTINVCAYTSLCWACSSISSLRPESSGRNRSARPVSTSRRRPVTGSAPQSSFVNSSRIRSAVIRSRSAAMSRMAARTASSTVNRSLEANRAARSIRSGSSPNDSAGVPGVRMSPAARSARPPYGSVNSWPGRLTAIALIVKSRRRRSSSSDVPYATVGFRVTPSYDSARNVVISMRSPSRCTPIVPNSRPVSQIASAQPFTIARVWSGWASVQKSRSSPSRPSSASRTEPPTRCSSCPAAAKRRPSSSATGETRRSSATALRCAALKETVDMGVPAYTRQDVRMPIPPALCDRIEDPAFWSALLDRTGDLGGDLRISLPVAGGYGLVLDLAGADQALGLREPHAHEPVQLGWAAPDRPHPAVLRFAELELCCRVIALDDPTLPHPGLPMAMLARFAPDDAPAARATLEAAYRSLRRPVPPVAGPQHAPLPLFADERWWP